MNTLRRPEHSALHHHYHTKSFQTTPRTPPQDSARESQGSVPDVYLETEMINLSFSENISRQASKIELEVLNAKIS